MKDKKKEELPAFYQLSLKKVLITGDVFGKFGDFTIEQVFVNERPNPLEVSYTFPITETATVTGFTVQVGEKIMHGVCKEKEEAKKEYVEHLAKGDSAYMLNQDTGNVFDVMVGKVLPGEEVHIRISYLDMYTVVDNKIRLIIPTLVNQRYRSEITDGLTYGKVDYTVDFKINVHKVLAYTSIKSVNHKVKQMDEDNMVVITAENYDMSKDFVLDMAFQDAAISNACYSDTRDGEKAVLLSFMPEIEEYEDSEKEYIFVVDVSGSMSGSNKMQKTKQALKRCLQELDVGDTFNILPFESEFSFYKPESIEATEENIKDATKFVDQLHASGGTEILKPLQFALYEKSNNKVVIVLTDGEVGNESEIVNFISKSIYDSKLFALGIDTSVNTSFIKNMAKAGNGKAEFIYPNEDMEDAIVRTFARIQSPLIRHVKVDYGKNEVLDEVKEDNALFNYEFFQVMALLKDIQDDITLKGMIGEKEISWKIAKDEMQKMDGQIELIYAKKSIDALEEQMHAYHGAGGAHRLHDVMEEYKKKIVEKSVKYNIASEYTSFISVNEREEKVFGAMDFENVRLSDREMQMAGAPMMDMAMPGMGGAPMMRKMAARTGGMFAAKSHRMDDSVIFCEDKAPYLTTSAPDTKKEEIEKALADFKNIDIETFLLDVCYLYRRGTTMPLESIFKEYMQNYTGNIQEENIQQILLYLHQQGFCKKYIEEELLKGMYQKIAVTGAKYEVRLGDVHFQSKGTCEKNLKLLN